MLYFSGNDVILVVNVRFCVIVLGWKFKRCVDFDEESFNFVFCGFNYLLLF